MGVVLAGTETVLSLHTGPTIEPRAKLSFTALAPKSAFACVFQESSNYFRAQRQLAMNLDTSFLDVLVQHVFKGLCALFGPRFPFFPAKNGVCTCIAYDSGWKARGL
jgi:hypothetical protein